MCDLISAVYVQFTLYEYAKETILKSLNEEEKK